MSKRNVEPTDERFMMKALELAGRGRGKTSPNPLVGAVLVKDGSIIGEGWHECFGQAHAEVNAIHNARNNRNDPANSTLYVNLEPCCHHGKTPPCTNLIIESGIRRVVVGMTDPNHLVAGIGAEQLKQAGIDVETGVLEEDCRRLNEVFCHYITTQRPFVIVKAAVTLDGKIAAYTGDSKWISGEASRREVQELRNQYTAVMVGIHTVMQDDPELTCRLPDGRNPLKIILDSQLRIPKKSRVLIGGKILLACTEEADSQAAAELENLGAGILRCKSKDGQVDLVDLMEKLGTRGIDSILLEGGGTVNASALSQGIVNKLRLYMSPKILGGGNAKTFVEGLGVSSPEIAHQFRIEEVGLLGEDIRITAYPVDHLDEKTQGGPLAEEKQGGTPDNE